MRWLFLALLVPAFAAVPALAAELPIHDCAEGGYEETATPSPVPDTEPVPSS